MEYPHKYFRPRRIAQDTVVILSACLRVGYVVEDHQGRNVRLARGPVLQPKVSRVRAIPFGEAVIDNKKKRNFVFPHKTTAFTHLQARF